MRRDCYSMKTNKKKLSGVLLLILLSSCSLLPQKFDSNEYVYYVTLYQQSKYLSQICGDADLVKSYSNQMYVLSEQLNIYASYTGNKDSKLFASSIFNQIKAFKPSGISMIFCENYAENLQTSLESVLKTIGGRSK